MWHKVNKVFLSTLTKNIIKMKELSVDTREALDQMIKENSDKNLILLFTGNKNSQGKSWCPDCVVADPIIKDVCQEMKNSDMVFVTISVGDLPTWKSSNNVFRSHPTLAINCVPTLINVGKNQRLEEGGCADKTLVKKLFEGSLQDAVTSKGGTCEGGVCRIR